MTELWNPNVRHLKPYVPGEQPRGMSYIKLNTNENPYPPSPQVQALLQAHNWEEMRRYPDPSCTLLKQTLAAHYRLESNQVFVGNGSDEVLGHAFRALFKSDQAILYPSVSYGFYPVYQHLFNLQAISIPLNDDFGIDLQQYRQTNGGVIIANPNAPTGLAVSLADIESFLQTNSHSVVIIDEAYVDFGGDSASVLVNDYPQLLVVKTFSKSRSLAGMRVGYALGHSGLIEALERVKFSFHPYALSAVQMKAAIAAIEDDEYFQQTRQRIMTTRERFTQGLQDLGFDVLPSCANFVFARPPACISAQSLQQALKDQGVLIRYFEQPVDVAGFVRISIGTDEEMDVALASIAKVLKGKDE